MNNTDKLLRAFIEASGFEVEEIKGRMTEKEKEEVRRNAAFLGHPAPSEDFLSSPYGIDYKVTKKKPYIPITAQSKEWACVVGYLLAHDTDIEAGVNDYGDLKPMLDFFNRNSTRASRSEWELGK
jgi:hypothetical protein